jgi:UDP-glucose 4-epimerase
MNKQQSFIKEIKQILLIGISGGLSQILAKILLDAHTDLQIIGVDSREIRESIEHPRLRLISMRYSRGNFENLFRDHHFDAVYHLGRISHSSSDSDDLERRLELSVMGTNRILDLCHRFAVKKVVVLSTFHVYGALPDNSVFIHEEMPLRASMHYAELRDVVEMDQICTNWMWKFQHEVETVVLRPCNIIGNKINNTMTRFLNAKVTLSPMDFNPVFQFIHEFDMAHILARSLFELPTGIYNVAPLDYITLKKALKIIDNIAIPFPMTLASSLNQLLHILKLEIPDYLIDYLKFSCLIDNTHIRKYLGDDLFRLSLIDSLKLLKLK